MGGRKACSPGTSGSPFSSAWRLPRSRSAPGADGGGDQRTTLPRSKPRRNSHVPRDPSVPSPSICPARPLPRPLRKGSGWLDTDGGREEGRTLLESPGQARKSCGTFPRALSVESCLHPRVTGSAGSGGSGPVDPIPPTPPNYQGSRRKVGPQGPNNHISALCLRRHPPSPALRIPRISLPMAVKERRRESGPALGCVYKRPPLRRQSAACVWEAGVCGDKRSGVGLWVRV